MRLYLADGAAAELDWHDVAPSSIRKSDTYQTVALT